MRRCLAAAFALLFFFRIFHFGQSFEKYTLEIFRHELSMDTLSLHYILADPAACGIKTGDATLGDLSAKAWEEELAWLAACRERLEEYMDGGLDREEQLAAELLAWWADGRIALDNFYYYQEPLSPTLGIQAQLPVLLAEFELRSEEDIELYFRLLAELPAYFSQLAQFEEEKADAGLFMNDDALEQVAGQCRAMADMDDSHFLAASFSERLEDCSFLTADQKISCELRNLNALNRYVRPAYRQLGLALEALRGRGICSGGLYYTPDGISYYEYLLRYSVGTDLSIPVIRKMLEEQIAGDYETILFAIHEGVDVLALTEPAPSAYSADEILDILERRIQDDFPAAPDISRQVKEVPEALEDWLSPAFYVVPVLDRPEENTIYINPKYEPDGMDLVTTLAHEGYPGHLYQNAFERQGRFALTRALAYVGGYTEGWGLYSEFYAFDFLGLTDTEADFLRALSSLNFAICAVLDLAVHTEGWTPEDCSRYLSSFGISGQEQTDALYQDILEDPSNYLKYYLGYLEICRLKESALALSPAISVSDFHEWFLTAGPAPFFLLKERLTLPEISADLLHRPGEDIQLGSVQPFHDRLHHTLMIGGMPPVDRLAFL